MDILRRIGLFNWRMAASADLYVKLKSYQEMHNSNTSIKRLNLQRDEELMDQKLKDREQAVLNIAAHSCKAGLSAFHIEAGMN
ncbi:MAG: hypothetical protein ACXABY_16560 [Candidatus Thorarchaeota archaeon]|jgi:acetylglutamate kinase